MSKFDLYTEEYSTNSVVRGDTRTFKEDLKKLGGKYNASLRGGPGWIFSKKQEGDVNKFISGGVRLVSDVEASLGEEKTKAWEKKTPDSGKEDKIKSLESRIAKLEKIVEGLTHVALSSKATIPQPPKKPIKVVANTSDVDSSSDDDTPPPKRLMKK